MSSPDVHSTNPVLASRFLHPQKRAVGIRDIPLVFLTPKKLFSRVEDVPAYAWPLILLLIAVTAVGYATVETGLVDREVYRQVEEAVARLEKEQFDVVERSDFIKLVEEARKQGDFLRLMARGQVIVAQPTLVLASALGIAALLYGIVALTGRKPEWNTLLTLCVFASLIDLAGLVVRLALMLRLRTLDVDTSLAPLVALFVPSEAVGSAATKSLIGFLSAIDPFKIWFWMVLFIGLRVTRQLGGWGAAAMCVLFWLVAGGVRAGMGAALASQSSGAGI